MARPWPFVAGLELSRGLYEEGVRPVLARRFPGLAYGAARLEAGSEVLGFDTERSMDHDWGPRLTVYLPEAAWTPEVEADIGRVLGEELPASVHGVPTHFVGGSPAEATGRPLDHGVLVTTLKRVLRGWLGVDVDVGGEGALTLAEWLTIPEHQLRAFTSGAVFRDDTGALARARAALGWYPRDVWLYLLAAQWRRVAQEEPFVGRCAEVGDDLGSGLVAARLVREVMRLAFLMERRYAPYIKWFGSAFARLGCAAELTPSLAGALAAVAYPERERHLVAAYEAVARMHNALGVTPPLEPVVGYFHTRPYRVIDADRFCDALRAAITSPEVRRLAAHPGTTIGSTTLWADSTDLQARFWDEPLRQLYRSAPRP